MSVVVVSNRVPGAKAGGPMSGGLEATLIPVVSNYGATWIGFSGEAGGACPAGHSMKGNLAANTHALGTGTIVVVDAPAEHYDNYYEGFANSVLWPALHSRVDLVHAAADRFVASYREINAVMARELTRLGRSDSLVWVHDYHFLPLGAELRRLGVGQPIGFFLHTPWPSRSCISAVPHHREIVRDMLAYDLIGFQTDESRRNFEDYLWHELDISTASGSIAGERGLTQLATFPVGLDVDAFAARAAAAVARPDVLRLRAGLSAGKVVLGVDRLDYSKGLPGRFRAFARMLDIEPGLAREVSLLQVAAPSRAGIPAYRALKTELDSLVTEINGRDRQPGWTPIRYLNREFSQSTLAGLYRIANVGLVTPFRDGMNLVAKEFVVAQDPADPGVLVLSTFAGAARELDAALMVDPYDEQGMALKIASALTLAIEERRERWQHMMARLKRNSLQDWFFGFVNTLEELRPDRHPAAPVRSSISAFSKA